MRVRMPLSTLFTLLALFAFSASRTAAQLPNPGVEIDPERTALVITDPQNDFLSPEGVTWGVVGESVTENNTDLPPGTVPLLMLVQPPFSA